MAKSSASSPASASSQAAVAYVPAPYSVESLFDSRVVERHIAEGRTTRAAYEAYLAELPDESEEVLQSDLRFTVRSRPMATAGYDEEEQ